MPNYFFGDIESHNVGKQYGMSPSEFFRLGQWAWDDGPVQMTDDYDSYMAEMSRADYLVFHNGINFDLSVLYGQDSLEPLKLALQNKVIDTFYLAHLVTPAPITFVKRNGQRMTLTAKKSPVGHVKAWLALDNLCFQFGLPGKMGDLKALAKKYNPPKTLVADLDYSLIPLDDPEFREYAEGDIIAVRALLKYLLQKMKELGFPGHYVWREMQVLSATVGQISRNGILIDQEYAAEKIAAQEVSKAETMARLVRDYDFPTEGKAPWSSAEGKEVILKILDGYGINPETVPDWPRTPTGALKLGGEELKMITEGTDAYEFVEELAILKGMRTTSQQVMDALKEDGRVHPQITSLQKSGRWSFTEPGVTIFGERTEELKKDKRLFMAGPGKVLAGFDYSSADARAMAALSGDPEFAKRFEVDEDGNALHDAHNLTGEAIFTADNYYGDGPRDKKARPILRFPAKATGLGLNYNMGAYKLATTLNLECKKNKLDMHFWAPSKRGIPEIPHQPGEFLTRDMIEAFNQRFAWLKNFKDRAVKEAEETGYIRNAWGRWMKADQGREYTQGPALYGQSSTREMMADAVLRLVAKGDYYARALRAIIHDELLCEFDEETIERDIAVVKECMEVEYDPGTPESVPIMFPVGHGWGKTWYHASH